MTRVLIVKTSSMGDIIHTLPALTDAQQHCPDIRFDWVVEQSFAEVPGWHSAVDQIIPVKLRQWRKQPLRMWFNPEFRQFRRQLLSRHYDYIIDAQALCQSALVARLARGLRCGYDRQSVREFPATWFYQRTVHVAKQQHAVTRMRQLFAQILQYPVPQTLPDYGVRAYFSALQQPLYLPVSLPLQPYLVFLHATTWDTKLWPESYWVALGQRANQAGFSVVFTSGNTTEKARADRLAAQLDVAQALPRLSIVQVGQLLSRAHGSVAVDTGFGHLCAALSLPCVSLYGATSPTLTSAYGQNQTHLQADLDCAPCLKRSCQRTDRDHYAVQPPCFEGVTSERVWQELTALCERAAI